MNLDLAGVLSVVTVVLATGLVPLGIYIGSRRAELRKLDTTSDSTQITSAATLVAMLQDQIKVLTTKLEKAESQQTTDRTTLTEQLTRAHDENSRMAAIIATLRTDLDIADRQIAELRAGTRMRMGTNSAQIADDIRGTDTDQV